MRPSLALALAVAVALAGCAGHAALPVPGTVPEPAPAADGCVDGVEPVERFGITLLARCGSEPCWLGQCVVPADAERAADGTAAWSRVDHGLHQVFAAGPDGRVVGAFVSRDATAPCFRVEPGSVTVHAARPLERVGATWVAVDFGVPVQYDLDDGTWTLLGTEPQPCPVPPSASVRVGR